MRLQGSWVSASVCALSVWALGCGGGHKAHDAQGTSGDSAEASAGTGAASSGAVGDKTEDCDANGIWIARLTTFSRDAVFGAVQTASNWYYYELKQDGDDFTVTSHMDCGFQVSGSANVTLNEATTHSLLHRNDQTGRHGSFYKDGKRCVFTLDRFYSTRGVPRTKYLPTDTSKNPELSSLMAALPTQDDTTGSEDWDDDGSPGITCNVAGIGTRDVVQRDWNEAQSDADYPVALRAGEFVVRAHFDSQEGLLATSGKLGGLLTAGSSPAQELEHRMVFRWLGASESAAAVKALRGVDDVTTCFNVQDALPHDTASK